MATGGDYEYVAIASRKFAIVGGADIGEDLGGFTTEITSNGDGSTNNIRTRKPWMIEGLQIVINRKRGDLRFLQDVQNGTADGGDSDGNYAIVVKRADATKSMAVGTVSGDLKAQGASASATISLSGPGELRKQS